MKRTLYILLSCILSLAVIPVWGQADKSDVRKGNRDFRKGEFKEAEIDYRKAVLKDTSSVAAGYNLANTLYRQGDYQGAMKALDSIKEEAPMSASSADYFYNLGDAALAVQDYKTAVEAFGQSLLRNPGDLAAKENYIYARKKLQDQQQNQQNQQNDQKNQDNQDNQDNKDNQDNQDQQNDQDKDQNKDQNKDNQDQNQNQDQQNNPQQSQGQQPKITPQAAQQMLQAIQAKEKETQEKVKKQKAEALKSRQKEKNW
jgi:tetratricopeptide (TPR) repeat protein